MKIQKETNHDPIDGDGHTSPTPQKKIFPFHYHPFNFSPISVIEVLKKIFLGIALMSFLFQGSHSFLVSSGGQTDDAYIYTY